MKAWDDQGSKIQGKAGGDRAQLPMDSSPPDRDLVKLACPHRVLSLQARESGGAAEEQDLKKAHLGEGEKMKGYPRAMPTTDK